ncbi:MAG TPA: response regulator transcription factor [Epulopiscium sp.]|nr:response regulator transcription factor [Candidatus Epulonipiscium sp.]
MNCIIVDDESPAIQELRYFVTNFSSIKILEEFEDSLKALEYIQKNTIDVIFLDINMPKLDGLTLSKVIATLDPVPILVFISAYKEYALDAFQVAAFDYIVKPYSEERIVSTLNRLEACKSTKCINCKLSLWKNDKLHVVNLEDIYYCQSDEHEVVIYTKKDEYRITSTVSGFYEKLPQNSFFRCHRSYIVNIDKIIEIIPWFNSTYMVKLQGLEREIPVSRQNIAQFKQLMGI